MWTRDPSYILVIHKHDSTYFENHLDPSGIWLSFSSSTPWDVKGKKWRPLQFPPPIDKCHYSLARPPRIEFAFGAEFRSSALLRFTFHRLRPSHSVEWSKLLFWKCQDKRQASERYSFRDWWWMTGRQARFKGGAVTIGYMVHRFKVIPVLRSIFGSSRLTVLLVKLPKIRPIR